MLTEDYDGEFPTSSAHIRPFGTTLESHDGMTPVASPTWLDLTRTRAEQFDQLMRSGDLETAWLCLNCTGWSFKTAAKAATYFAKEKMDPTVEAMLDIWVFFAQCDSGEY